MILGRLGSPFSNPGIKVDGGTVAIVTALLLTPLKTVWRLSAPMVRQRVNDLFPRPGPETPRQQHSKLGKALKRTGTLLTALGGALFAQGAYIACGFVNPKVWESDSVRQGTFQLTLIFLGGGMLIFLVGRRFARRGRRHLASVISRTNRTEQTYVLYLRPFHEDLSAYTMDRPYIENVWAGQPMAPDNKKTEEELLVTQFERLGRVIAVGHPDERIPFSGAERLYLPKDNWKPVVSDLIRDARLVVLVAGDTEGTLWEFTEVVRLLPLSRLIILIYGKPRNYLKFRHAVGPAFSTRAKEFDGQKPALHPPGLPLPPAVQERSMQRKQLIWGAVHFPLHQKPEFWLLRAPGLTVTPTHRREVNSQVKEFLEKVETQLNALESET
ncbi:hypothetical protein [Streptomyces daliensis]|uniref:Uncharacterized protein n=1 Tax=Streptomyces daliensis TaxID=299421 RepID=A0A8T4IKZ5_9ACTN|nr:hypothetical protein [Streptomyces daliensis]